ncbi:hypothetical protein FQR65_LT14816 [Abscondita terminalis]|nr:hypothetical protein FQR65_LT14816 [Abscondita terminalis]
MNLEYPKARRDDTIQDVYHGVTVSDPYRWLENPDAEETIDFVNKQNAITNPYINNCIYKDIINTKLTNLWNYPKVSTPFLRGSKYYQFRNSGLQNQSVLYILDNLKDEGKVFLDPNNFSSDGTVALAHTSFSENGETLAYGVSASGSDWLEIKFRNVQSGEDSEEVLKKVKYSFLSWAHDNRSCFYAAYLDQEGKTDGSETESSTNQKLYFHRLGTPQSEDFVVVEFDDPHIRIQTNISDCGDYLILTPIKGCKNNLLYYCHLKAVGHITGKLTVTPIVTEFKADYEFIANNGSKFIFRTNKDAPNYQLIQIDFNNPAENNWEVLIPEHPHDVLDWANPINNDNIVCCYIHDVKDTLALFKMNGEKVMDFKLEVGSIMGFLSKRSHTQMFFGFTSFLTPNIIYSVDFTKQPITTEVWHETKVGDFNPSLYESKQIFYKSKDGTNIPMFIIYKKDMVLNGSNPCLLYGYGGFNVSIGPSFAISRLIFMDNFNGVLAVANIRGGGEYGESWHNAGRFDNKQNVFDDFQYASRYLIRENYTSANLLTIQGGSNGGLLVAACANQAPQLFGCVLCLVGVLDMLRYHKFTIGYAWKSDYGCSDDEDQFKYLYEYSPLHNIKIPPDSVQYPATLLLTADHDDRVVPLHSLKFIAELQHKIGSLPQQKNPLLIRVDTKSGHGAGKPISKIIEEQTEMLCFMQKSLNLPYTI